jgi:arginyl-tRNA synthetase
MNIEQSIGRAVAGLYRQRVASELLQLQKTKREFEGQLTLVVFPLLKISRKKPEDTAREIGEYLLANDRNVTGFNAVGGFLNLTVAPAAWLETLNAVRRAEPYGIADVRDDAEVVMIEYSSPNTNKPLHLGHVRNNLLGYSLAEILKANGYRVIKTNIVNDRGIHICKSMLAWLKWGDGATPESTEKKGDHLTGDFYVLFDRKYREEIAALEAAGMSRKEAEEASTLMAEAREMLRKWEDGDPDTRALWSTMNGWVYEGFEETYRRLGVDFDRIYYESETYLAGRKQVMEGVEKGVFYRRDDGSIWADLTAGGLDEKLLLRADGTSVYITQDIGTATLRFDDYRFDRMIYVVGNEQNYHFQVLALLLDRLGFAFGRKLVHFSYGMVELPDGKMKSREGTVVDADDLMDEMVATARETSERLGKLDGRSDEEAARIAEIVGLGALKYFILKVDPRKNMTFNPGESIDFNGNTGPFVQYAYARIRSVMRKAEALGVVIPVEIDTSLPVGDRDISLIQNLELFAAVVREAGETCSPALIANYAYDLAKEYNHFYHDFPILKETDNDLKMLRLALSETTGRIIRTAFSLLGIDVPERM